VSLANSADLQTAIAEWLYRTGDAALAARAADFITLFEADFTIDPEQRTSEMQVSATAPIAAAAVPLPADFLDMVRIKVTGNSSGLPDQPLYYVTPNRAAELDQSSQSQVGGFSVAKNFTVTAGQIVITPQSWAPIGATLDMVYYAFTPLATSSGGVNWLLQKYPNIYLYGSLMQAAAYVDDDRTVAKWKAGLDQAMAKLAATERKRKLGASPMAVSPSANFIR
jgi:hypothetical protein